MKLTFHKLWPYLLLAFALCFTACTTDYSTSSIEELRKTHQGVYFELSPVFSIAHERALADYANDLRLQLRNHKLRFTSLFYDNKKFVIKFYNADDRFEGYKWIKDFYQKKDMHFVINRSDKNNEFALKFRLTPRQYKIINDSVVRRITAIIKKRGALLEASFTKVENRDGKLGVYMLNLNDIKPAQVLLQMNRKVYFSEGKRKSGDSKDSVATIDREDIPDKDGVTYRVNTKPIITNNHISDVVPGYGTNNTPAIQITLNKNGAKKMTLATSKMVDKTIVAVVAEYDFTNPDKGNNRAYRVKKLVISAARVTTPIGKKFLITGIKDVHTAQLYSYQFASGYYPVPIHILSARKFTPTLNARPRPTHNKATH